ncbi:hypothetical protein ACQ4PT_015235 [Festuca glaucescens]
MDMFMSSFGISHPCMRVQGPLAKHNAMAAASFLFLLILATASSVGSASETSNGSCFLAERVALLSFKAGITSDPANLLISWQQGHHDYCRWGGVTCSNRTGHIIKLDVRNRSPTENPDSHSLRGQLQVSQQERRPNSSRGAP